MTNNGAKQVVSELTIECTAFNHPTVSNQVSNHFSLMEIDDIDRTDFDHTAFLYIYCLINLFKMFT